MLPAGFGRVFDSMNKHISLKRAALAAVTLGALGATAAFAQTVPTPAATTTTTTTTGTGGQQDGGGWHHHRHHFGAGVLSQTERAELKKDKDQVLAANPALKTQEENLHAQFKTLKSQNPPRNAGAVRGAEAAARGAQDADAHGPSKAPTRGAAALFQKIDAAKGQHHHHGA